MCFLLFQFSLHFHFLIVGDNRITKDIFEIQQKGNYLEKQ